MKKYYLYLTFLFISSIACAADWRKNLTKKVYASEDERQKHLAIQEVRKAEYEFWKAKTYFCEICNVDLKQKENGRIESHKAREHGICHECDFKSNDFFEMMRHLNTHLPTNVELKKHALDEE